MSQPPPSLIRFQNELESAIRRELAQRSPPRRRSKIGWRLAAGAVAIAAVAGVIVLTSTAGPEVQNAEAMAIKGATQALQPPPGTILHIDSTLTTSLPFPKACSSFSKVGWASPPVAFPPHFRLGCLKGVQHSLTDLAPISRPLI